MRSKLYTTKLNKRMVKINYKKTLQVSVLYYEYSMKTGTPTKVSLLQYEKCESLPFQIKFGKDLLAVFQP